MVLILIKISCYLPLGSWPMRMEGVVGMGHLPQVLH